MVRMLFVFKQKTAYEMRISDWSSDVCSSDLGQAEHAPGILARAAEPVGVEGVADQQADQRADQRIGPEQRRAGEEAEDFSVPAVHGEILSPPLEGEGDKLGAPAARSEEHTSELQSLMRISYAVFCLKKKKNKSLQRRSYT